jgi:hypothetical protein
MADATLNFINGCEVVSPGCTNCYAMRLAGTRLKHHPSRAGLTRDQGGAGVERLRASPFAPPVSGAKWKRSRRIFWNAHGDMFLGAVPQQWIDLQFAVMALTPQHTHMILTKRSKRMRAYLSRSEDATADCGGDPAVVEQPWGLKGPQILPLANRARDEDPEHVTWLPLQRLGGRQCRDQERADQRCPDLLTSSGCRALCICGSLLGPVDGLPKHRLGTVTHRQWHQRSSWRWG